MGNVIVLDEIKNLGLINIPGVGPGVQYSIGVNRKILTA
jgi:hypothetical protein